MTINDRIDALAVAVGKDIADAAVGIVESVKGDDLDDLDWDDIEATAQQLSEIHDLGVQEEIRRDASFKIATLRRFQVNDEHWIIDDEAEPSVVLHSRYSSVGINRDRDTLLAIGDAFYALAGKCKRATAMIGNGKPCKCNGTITRAERMKSAEVSQ